jgi:hypothetical protein
LFSNQAGRAADKEIFSKIVLYRVNGKNEQKSVKNEQKKVEKRTKKGGKTNKNP